MLRKAIRISKLTFLSSRPVIRFQWDRLASKKKLMEAPNSKQRKQQQLEAVALKKSKKVQILARTKQSLIFPCTKTSRKKLERKVTTGLINWRWIWYQVQLLCTLRFNLPNLSVIYLVETRSEQATTLRFKVAEAETEFKLCCLATSSRSLVTHSPEIKLW